MICSSFLMIQTQDILTTFLNHLRRPSLDENITFYLLSTSTSFQVILSIFDFDKKKPNDPENQIDFS